MTATPISPVEIDRRPNQDVTSDSDAWGGLSDLPGNPMMWILILSELAVFGAGIAMFAVARSFDPALFDASQAHLDRWLAGINTLILVTSGFLAALAVEASRDGRHARCRRLLTGSIAGGVAFVIVKLIEYGDKAALGIGLETNTFFTLYYLLTGFHLLHVVMGVIVLAIVGWKNSLHNVETGTAFWHMVDLIWLLLFPVLYIVH